MKVQFPVRWADKKRLSPEEERSKRAIDGDDLDAIPELEYSYGSVILDTRDIRAYNDLDGSHSIMRTYQNDSYCVTISFEDLKQIMVELTGDNITIISRKPIIIPKKKKKDDEDLII